MIRNNYQINSELKECNLKLLEKKIALGSAIWAITQCHKYTNERIKDLQMFKDAGIAARGEGNFVVFNGPDEQFVSGRVIGADGGIGGTYAVMPELYLAMNAHLEKGEIAKARAIQYEANRIIYKMCSAHGNLYAVQKEILRRMYGLELGSVRAPMPGLIPEDEAVVAEAQAMIEAAIAKL